MKCLVGLFFIFTWLFLKLLSWHHDLTIVNVFRTTASSPYSHYVSCSAMRHWNRLMMGTACDKHTLVRSEQLPLYFKWWTDCLLEDENYFPFLFIWSDVLISLTLSISSDPSTDTSFHSLWIALNDFMWFPAHHRVFHNKCIVRRWRSCDLLIWVSGWRRAWRSVCGCWGLFWTVS